MTATAPADILLLGSAGRLGAALARAWSPLHRVRALSRGDVDVADSAALRRVLRGERYGVLVNATGATSLEACEDDPAMARALNAVAPAVMAQEAAAAGALMIHFGTDYVFDGAGAKLLREDDPVGPLSVYGRTKLDGEQAVLAASPRHVCFRVSWIFGPDKPSFIDAMLARALDGLPVEAVGDKSSCPTFSEDAAVWFEPFLGGGLPGGLYHACNGGGACSWKEFAQEGVDLAARLGWPVRTRAVAGIPMRSVAAFRAVRPPHTAMDCAKLAAAIGHPPRPWREALAAYLAKKSSGSPG
jgi:dTDP-4-dehydrorhamnose reductase